jgi:hypothetical protein
VSSLSSWKQELVRLHVHAAASKTNAFGLEPQALFNGGVATEFDLSTRAKHSLPWQAERSGQHLRNLA